MEHPVPLRWKHQGSRHQAPKKHQAPSSNFRMVPGRRTEWRSRTLMFDVWGFFGAWGLVPGASAEGGGAFASGSHFRTLQCTAATLPI
jgi:hypothetical protein